MVRRAHRHLLAVVARRLLRVFGLARRLPPAGVHAGVASVPADQRRGHALRLRERPRADHPPRDPLLVRPASHLHLDSGSDGGRLVRVLRRVRAELELSAVRGPRLQRETRPRRRLEPARQPRGAIPLPELPSSQSPPPAQPRAVALSLEVRRPNRGASVLSPHLVAHVEGPPSLARRDAGDFSPGERRMIGTGSPVMRSHRFQIGLTLLYAVLFGAIYSGTNWLSARRDPPTAPHFAFEMAIPFVPAMAWFYLSVPFMLCVGPLILRTKRELLPFFFTLTAQLVVAALSYLVVPFSLAWPPRAVEGPGTGAFEVADTLNLDYNLVPS